MALFEFVRAELVERAELEAVRLGERREVELTLVAVRAQRLVPQERVRVRRQLLRIGLVAARHVVLSLEQENTPEAIPLAIESLVIAIEEREVILVAGEHVLDVEAVHRAFERDQILERVSHLLLHPLREGEFDPREQVPLEALVELMDEHWPEERVTECLGHRLTLLLGQLRKKVRVEYAGHVGRGAIAKVLADLEAPGRERIGVVGTLQLKDREHAVNARCDGFCFGEFFGVVDLAGREDQQVLAVELVEIVAGPEKLGEIDLFVYIMEMIIEDLESIFLIIEDIS